jgi:hypothetical protein
MGKINSKSKIYKILISLFFLFSITTFFGQGTTSQNNEPSFSDDVIDNPTANPIDSNIVSIIGLVIIYGFTKTRKCK